MSVYYLFYGTQLFSWGEKCLKSVECLDMAGYLACQWIHPLRACVLTTISQAVILCTVPVLSPALNCWISRAFCHLHCVLCGWINGRVYGNPQSSTSSLKPTTWAWTMLVKITSVSREQFISLIIFLHLPFIWGHFFLLESMEATMWIREDSSQFLVVSGCITPRYRALIALVGMLRNFELKGGWQILILSFFTLAILNAF